MMSIYIRPLEQSDESFLWEMLYMALFVPEGYAPLPKSVIQEPNIAKYVAGWGNEGDAGCIAADVETQAAVGAVWVRLFPEENQGYGYVAADIPELSIAILPEYRQQGLGTQLLKCLFEQTRGRYRGLSLSVSPENPAVPLYKRLGFEVVGQSGSSLTMVRMF